MQPVQLFLIVLSTLSPALASPQYGGGRGNFGGSGFSSGSPQSGGSFGPGSSYTSSSSFLQMHRVLIAHAVMATTAWAFFFPLGSIFLRLNINHPIMLKLHIFCQIFAYCIYVTAAGMGIWLALETQQYFDVWADPHPIIGLVILGFATLQPITGWIHHRIFKSRAMAIAATNRGPRPGRTMWGRFHLWTGRCLITLGVINGGLGLRLMEGSPTQDKRFTHNAEIGYSIAAGLMWCIYVFITVIWEAMRSARMRKQQYHSSRSRRRGNIPHLSSSDSSLKPARMVPG